jgi:hypothetical protein
MAAATSRAYYIHKMRSARLRAPETRHSLPYVTVCRLQLLCTLWLNDRHISQTRWRVLRSAGQMRAKRTSTNVSQPFGPTSISCMIARRAAVARHALVHRRSAVIGNTLYVPLCTAWEYWKRAVHHANPVGTLHNHGHARVSVRRSNPPTKPSGKFESAAGIICI